MKKLVLREQKMMRKERIIDVLLYKFKTFFLQLIVSSKKRVMLCYIALYSYCSFISSVI